MDWLNKRYLSMMIMVILLIPCMVIPASAAPSGVYDTYEEGIFDYVSYYLPDIESIKDFLQSIDDYCHEIRDEARTRYIAWENLWTADFITLRDKLTGISDYLKEVRDDVDLFIAQLAELPIFLDIEAAINEVRDKVSGMNNNIHDAIVDQTSYLGGYYHALSEQISGYITTQKEAIVTAIDNLGKLLKGSEDQQQAADKFQDDVTQEETQVDDYLDDLATSPTVDNAGLDDISDAIINNGFPLNETYLSIIGVMLDNHTGFTVIPIVYSFVFAIVGYILFGKRY